MLLIGSHVSFRSSDQLVGSVKEAISYGSNCFMFYTGAPQNTLRSPINDKLIDEAYTLMKENNISLSNVIIHAPYIINLANDKEEKNYNFAISFLRDEIDRCIHFGVKKIVLHPGSHVGLTAGVGINNIVYAINSILKPDDDIIICLETMTGKGSEIGDIDELAEIISGIKLKDKVMICIDTCHMNDHGYDMSKFDDILDVIEEKIGKNKIGCIHINDSYNVCGVRKDRHQNIGFGTIGFNNLVNIIYNDRLKNIPKILETPYLSVADDSKDKIIPPFYEEIKMIKEKKFNPNMIDELRQKY